MTAPSTQHFLLITYEYPPVGGGTGKAVQATARELARMGVEVTILTSRFRGQPAESRDDGARVLRLPVLRRHLNYATALEVLSFALSGWWAARGLSLRLSPDLTVAYFTIPCGVVAARIARLGGRPFVTFLRGQDVPGYPETPPWMHVLAWPLTRRLWRRSAAIIANSRWLAELARQADGNLRPSVVANGVDLERYRPNVEREARANGGPRFLYVGRLIRSKRLRELLEAWRRLQGGRRASWELHLVGFGPERRRLEQIVRQGGLEATVLLRGRLEEPSLVEALQEADVFVNPSAGEGLPNAVLEAMACGLPLVLSDIGPHRELVEAGAGALLCDTTRPEALAEGLIALGEDPERRARLGRASRAAAESAFGWPTVARRLMELLASTSRGMRSEASGRRQPP